MIRTQQEEKAMVKLRKNDRQGSAWFPKAGLGLFIHWGISAVDGYLDLSWGMMGVKIGISVRTSKGCSE